MASLPVKVEEIKDKGEHRSTKFKRRTFEVEKSSISIDRGKYKPI